ncbi:unnamed protein product [Protopolystoma xenopodis]|uniref:Uncharacterized protein n=1 Tax=Protopolystoma xenopodis TaxID=117903 RepID=A0A3S4ZXZ5_9PLAT|nr:unnamed protein product [Protopolystoma xenopodis]
MLLYSLLATSSDDAQPSVPGSIRWDPDGFLTYDSEQCLSTPTLSNISFRPHSEALNCIRVVRTSRYRPDCKSVGLSETGSYLTRRQQGNCDHRTCTRLVETYAKRYDAKRCGCAWEVVSRRRCTCCGELLRVFEIGLKRLSL